MEQLVAPVTLMAHSGLPCFRAASLQRLIDRFAPDASEADAVAQMVANPRTSPIPVSRA